MLLQGIFGIQSLFNILSVLQISFPIEVDIITLTLYALQGTLDKHLECLKNVNNDGVKEMVKFVTENKLEL